MGIELKCTRCQGTGNIDPYGEPPQSDCPDCGGDGLIEWGEQLDVITKLDAIDTKLDTIDTHLDTIETKIDALE